VAQMPDERALSKPGLNGVTSKATLNQWNFESVQNVEEIFMALFVIERNFAEQLALTNDDVRLVKEINGDIGVHWLFSFLSADKKKTYCLYEASSAEAIREAARRAGLPADVIVEVSELRPEAFT
jgi:hypothetical protein